MKRWYESKTVWLGLATLLLSILTYLQGEEWVKQYPQVVSAIGIGIGVLTIFLRYFTRTAMVLALDVRDWVSRRRR